MKSIGGNKRTTQTERRRHIRGVAGADAGGSRLIATIGPAVDKAVSASGFRVARRLRREGFHELQGLTIHITNLVD